MKKPVIQSLWIGDRLSLIERLCVSSFLHHGHDFHLYTYGNLECVPEGTILRDANEILAKEFIFTYRRGSYAGFADWFRWELLSRKGGLWVDMDVVCLKPFAFKSDFIFGLQSSDLVGSAVLGFPPNHDLCDLLKTVCERPTRILPYDNGKTRLKKSIKRLLRLKRQHIGWGEAGGPTGLTRALKHFQLFGKAKPFTYFYPIHYTCWDSIFDNTLSKDSDLFSDTHAIHLWNEMARLQNFDKDGVYPKESLIEQLKAKYL